MYDSELQEVHKWIKDNISKGCIKATSLSCASYMLFIQKKDGSLKLYMNYKALNHIIIQDQYLLLWIAETINHICSAKYCTHLDLYSVYNLIHIKERDEWKTEFQTWYRLFEFLVMLCRFTNTLATCQ